MTNVGKVGYFDRTQLFVVCDVRLQLFYKNIGKVVTKISNEPTKWHEHIKKSLDLLPLDLLRSVFLDRQTVADFWIWHSYSKCLKSGDSRDRFLDTFSCNISEIHATLGPLDYKGLFMYYINGLG